MNRYILAVVFASMCVWAEPGRAEENVADGGRRGFANVVQPVFVQRCIHCHGQEGKAEGDIDLQELKTSADLVARPELVERIMDAVDSGYMPPDEEPELPRADRDTLVTELRRFFRQGVALQENRPRTPLRRMNRFQYNNAVQDLFELNVVVFPLPERMLREHGDYFQPQTGKLPETVRAGSRPLGKSQLIERRLAGVTPFPQDLRAEHGFDNQADHLSLSPLLLESFLRLSRSIVESDDFHPKTCRIWEAFFAPPADTDASDTEGLVRQRLEWFLTRAFRRPVQPETRDRYARHVLARIASGASFPDAMKDAAAAALASPRFLYLSDFRQSPPQSVAETDASDAGPDGPQPIDAFALASRLSFFLWGSLPDETLLELAASGQLQDPEVLEQQVERMLRDRKLKRFCDSFPAQWLQLDRIISSTPDPELYPQFYFAKYRASMHMMLEPLLLFEAVLIENRSILQFIDSDFSYRSDLLQAWYRDGTQGNPGSPVVVEFHRVPVADRREGGLITNAAVMTMTSGTTRTKPITRGAWVASVILNDPPEPPPGDVPPLPDKPAEDEKNLTLRERFAIHRQRADCAACHQRIDPLGFALENYNAAGIWRDAYANGRAVDASGTLFGDRPFRDVVEFKQALLEEKHRFARAFASHLLAFALGRPIEVADSPALDTIVENTARDGYRIHTVIKQVVLSEPFRY